MPLNSKSRSSGNPLIYLASESPRRKEILRRLGVRFKKVSSHYREKNICSLTPKKLVTCHAIGKAKGAIVSGKARYVLAADTIVWCCCRILGKPSTWREARKMLLQLSGRCHFVYTGIALWDRQTDKMTTGYSKTKVWIKQFKGQELDRYLKAVNPFDKAGAYAIQTGPKIVKKITGSYTNVMGLPKELVQKMLKKISRNSQF